MVTLHINYYIVKLQSFIMLTQKLDGKNIAEKIQQSLKEQVTELKK
jgi:hypothetical protein